MIVPQQIFFWGKRFFLYGSVVATGVFLIVVAAGSYQPKGTGYRGQVTGGVQTPVAVGKITALNIDALPPLVGDVALLPTVKAPRDPQKARKNLTEQFAASLARDVVAKNPAGPGIGLERKLATPDINAALDQFLKSNFVPPQLPSYASASDIKIIPDANVEVLGGYLRQFNDIFGRWMKGVSSFRAPDDLAHFFSLISTEQRNSARELQALVVPQLFVDAHKRAIDFLLSSSAVAATLSREADSDPLQATFLLSAFRRMRTDGVAITQSAAAVFARAVRYALHS